MASESSPGMAEESGAVEAVEEDDSGRHTRVTVLAEEEAAVEEALGEAAAAAEEGAGFPYLPIGRLKGW